MVSTFESFLVDKQALKRKKPIPEPLGEAIVRLKQDILKLNDDQIKELDAFLFPIEEKKIEEIEEKKVEEIIEQKVEEKEIEEPKVEEKKIEDKSKLKRKRKTVKRVELEQEKTIQDGIFEKIKNFWKK